MILGLLGLLAMLKVMRQHILVVLVFDIFQNRLKNS